MLSGSRVTVVCGVLTSKCKYLISKSAERFTLAKGLVYYLLRINHVSCLLGPRESQQHLCLVVPDGSNPARVGPAFQIVTSKTKCSAMAFYKLGVV